ncbi:hypothetical protein MRB53_027146 [Persea americana]|uniref:Uncharacterized protein n=1 Tax=Persea americana TaxID=3435 RepID=A0ACC2LK25_PERAE|nr:hypothetical protein MRB53_027146 [Persea americana]
MTWHAQPKEIGGVMRHPSDSSKSTFPVCAKGTISKHLKSGKRHSYQSHQRFLPVNHVFRTQKTAFNNKTEKKNSSSSIEWFRVGNYSTKLSSRCGQLIRTIVPTSYKDWRAVPNEKKDKLRKLLLEDFDVSQ